MRTTILCVVRWLLVLVALGGVLIAGPRKDYEVRAGKHNRLEADYHTHRLSDTIFYETASVSQPHETQITPEQKIECIRTFFEKYNAPVAQHAEVFVRVAAEFNLDWRLLPAIAFLESTGGKHQRKYSNNIFGWKSGRARFHDVEESIRVVGFGLTKGPYVNTQTTIQRLRLYNPRIRYHRNALEVMYKIETSEPLTYLKSSIE